MKTAAASLGMFLLIAASALAEGGAGKSEAALRPVRSESELEQSVRAEPVEWSLHAELLEASARAGQLDERARWYEAWLAEDSDTAPRFRARQAMLHAALGSVRWREGKWRAARSEYRQAVRLEPTNQFYVDNLRTIDVQVGWQRRDTLILLLLLLLIVAYVALRRRRWLGAMRG